MKKLNEKFTEEKALAIMEFLKKEGHSLWEVYQLMGWQPVGQHLVYGYERALGFINAANLCGRVEREVKKLRKNKGLTEEKFVELFVESFIINME